MGKICYFIATHKCNIKCEHCIDEKIEYKKKKLSFDKLMKFCIDSEVNTIVFTGGEPTLVSELPHMVKSAADFGIDTNIITNGTNINIVSKLKDSNITGVCVSLDGINAHTHNMLKKSKFELVIKTIKNLVENNIKCRVNCVVHSGNIYLIREMIEFIQSLGVNDITFSPLTLTKNLEGNLNIKEISKQEILKYKKDLIIWGHKFHHSKHVKNILSLYIDNIEKPDVCTMGKNGFVVDEYGDVYICFARKDLKCGNIQLDEFDKIIDNLNKYQLQIKNAQCFNKHCVTLEFPFER